MQSKPTRSFEFPDGYNTYLGVPRLSVPEILFNPQAHLPQEVSVPSSFHLERRRFEWCRLCWTQDSFDLTREPSA